MAWLLVRAFADPKATAWQRGDIVEVRPDDFTGWGQLETLPRFVRVRVTGVTDGQVKRILEQADEEEEIVELTDKFGVRQLVIRVALRRVRKWGVRVDDLPSGVRATLLSTGEITITRAQALNYIKNQLGDAVIF